MIGETKWIDLEISSKDNQDFTITSSNWSLESMGKEIDHGNATITGHNISVLLTAPEKVGQYKLVIWYNIPPEVIAAKVIVNVE